MSNRNEETLPASRPRSRKSIAHVPNSAMDKENMTTDLGALGSHKRAALGEKKKSRSKSIGPGGLDVLTDGTGNRRQSLAMPPPRSILKPTIPPLQEIPARRTVPQKSQPDDTTEKPDHELSRPGEADVTGANILSNPFSLNAPTAAVAETRVMLRTEEQQQQAAQEREEKDKQAIDLDVKARREARRKSLANRRVSFAPEATLHTWDVVEYAADSTTSSSSTSSTRRASSIAPQTPRPQESDETGSEPPSTPPEQIEEEPIASPAHQRDLHQKKRRRSSGIPPLNFNNPDDEFLSSSPYSGDSDMEEQDLIDGGDASDSNSESDDGTAMILDEGDDTAMSMASVRSAASSTGSSVRLEEALQLAARQAGTQGIDFDEHHGMGPVEEDEEEEVVSFKPWSQKSNIQASSAMQDQENVNPFSPAFKASTVDSHHDDDDDDDDTGMGMDMEITQAVGRIMPAEQFDEDMTMDITTAIGEILPSQRVSNSKRRKSVATRRQSNRRRSSGAESAYGDEAMDLTVAVGGIKQSQNKLAPTQEGEDEDMTMEFTSVIGGVLPPSRRLSGTPANRKAMRRISTESTQEDATMDMTVAVGSIMPSKPIEADDDDTFAMDMTMAVGKILPNVNHAGARSQAKRLMESEVDSSEPVSSPFQPIVNTTAPPAVQKTTMTSENGSPSLAAFRGKGLRRSGAAPRASTTPKSDKIAPVAGTPVKVPSTPAKQLTPKPARPATPGKTPPSRNVVMRSASPKQLFESEINTVLNTPEARGAKKSRTPNKLFQKDTTTGFSTPSIVLSHKRRRSSGLGIDREGLGSPRIVAILDRRASIGDSSRNFSPGQFQLTAPGVRFGGALDIEAELDKEREEEESRENSRKVMEREADIIDEEKDATVNLKEMIASLTPKKKPLKGRKSLHVGAAKGILGKRPTELDDDSDNDDSGVKRLKNHQGSPVKNVKLQAPPTKEETTGGRLTRAARRSLAESTGNITTPVTTISAENAPVVTTPKDQGRFKDVELSAQKPVPFVEKAVTDDVEELVEDSLHEEPLHLQDFLNMTNIRFMELTTTKRRHTVAPKRLSQLDAQEGGEDTSFESCVVASACTIPMLELFEHSCRELKKYISEGRGVVRTIESETLEENPPLFREYLAATPDVRMLMDNQFKNVKTHARHTSKGMWYQWRMQLLTGLMEGLNKTAEGMQDDTEIVQHQIDLLDSVLPPLIQEHQKLAQEEADLQAAANELTDCNQEELQHARQTLTALDEDVEEKKRMILALQTQIQEKDLLIQKAMERKQVCHDDIREAEKTREECRGWTGNEVLSLKAKVDALEKEHGWTVTGVSKGTIVSLSYRSDLELVFNISSFASTNQDSAPQNKASSQIDLWYIGGNRESSPKPITMEMEFFVENIRDHCRSLTQSETTVKNLLDTVSAAWRRALNLDDQVRSLSLEMPTETIKTSDNSIVASSMLLLKDIGTKVKFSWSLVANSTETAFAIDVIPHASVVYGNGFNEEKMTEFIAKRVLEGHDAERSWIAAVLELEDKLMARSRK